MMFALMNSPDEFWLAEYSGQPSKGDAFSRQSYPGVMRRRHATVSAITHLSRRQEQAGPNRCLSRQGQWSGRRVKYVRLGVER
jgi:hypothetical protein